jgi:hypothetical protein
MYEFLVEAVAAAVVVVVVVENFVEYGVGVGLLILSIDF